MTRSDTLLFDPRLATWLEDDPYVAPDEALDVVLAAIPSIKQRRAWRVSWRAPLMNAPLRLGVTAAAVLGIVGVSLIAINPVILGVGSGTGSPASSPTALPSESAAPASTRASLPATQPPVSFTSPLYGYTVTRPGDWTVTPAANPWPEGTALGDRYADTFQGPPGAYEDFDDVYVAAQPVPAGMTADAWLLDYAERLAASGRDCKGPVDAWTDAVVGTLTIRRIDLECQAIRLSDIAFVVDGTGYVMTGNREVIALYLDTFEPGD